MFKSEFDRGAEVIHVVLHGLELFGCAYEDQEDVIYESLPERISQMKASRMVSS